MSFHKKFCNWASQKKIRINKVTYKRAENAFIDSLACILSGVKEKQSKVALKYCLESKNSVIDLAKNQAQSNPYNVINWIKLGDDLRSIGRKKEALDAYKSAFEKYFLKSLTSRLIDYSSSKFEILGEDKKSSNYTIVNSRVIPSDDGPEIKIDWRIYTKNPDKPLIRDLIVEGLSLARTQKEEFSSILNSNDGDINILFKTLEEFSNN